MPPSPPIAKACSSVDKQYILQLNRTWVYLTVHVLSPVGGPLISTAVGYNKAVVRIRKIDTIDQGGSSSADN